MMRRSAALGLAFTCLGLIVAALESRAAPPANDQCAGAEIVSLAGPSPWYSSITTNMHEATKVGDPPQSGDCFGGAISNSVWYEFSPLETGLYTVSVKFTATTMPDTLMGIYTSPSGCAGPFTQYACNDDSGTLQSAITTNFNAGTKYYVVMWYIFTKPLEEWERDLQLRIVRVLPPANDLCETAEDIPSNSGFPHWTGIANTHLASTTGDPPGELCMDPSETLPQRSVWYRFRPTSGGQYIIATCTNNTATKIYNTMLAVYENTGGGCGGTNLLLRCNPGFCGPSAAIIMNLAPQTDYYIVVWDLASPTDPTPVPDETDVQLFVDRQGPPLVTTVGHSNVQPAAVTLIGSANPKGSLTRGYFEWGTTTNYGNVTINSTLGAGIVDAPFTRALGSIAPGTTIYYRAAAFNFFGTTFGEGKSVTLPIKIDSFAMQGNDFRVQFRGDEAYVYEVQASSDLKTWTRLGDATVVDVDQFEYIDVGARSRPHRFYRIKLVN